MVFGICNECCKVQYYNLFIKQGMVDFFLYDVKGEAFYDSSFINIRFINQNWVVFFLVVQDLRYLFDFVFMIDNGIQFVFFSQFGDIVAEIVQYWCVGF